MTPTVTTAAALERTESRMIGAFSDDHREAKGQRCCCWRCDLARIRAALERTTEQR